MDREIYNMGLHDTLELTGPENIQMLRVPGGWIYSIYVENGTGGYDMSSCFVPRNNEYDGKTKTYAASRITP